MRCQSCNGETGDSYYLLGKYKARVCYSSPCMVNYFKNHRKKEGDEILKYIHGRLTPLKNEDVEELLLKKWESWDT